MGIKARHPLVDDLVAIQEREHLAGLEMARRLDVVPSTYTRLVKGDVQPSLRIVQSVSRAFPELRVQCARLLQISTSEETDLQLERVPA